MYDTFERLPTEKRTAILASGIKEFSQKSYSEASTDAITKRSHISKGLLFHYFKSKSSFYLYCLETALQALVVEGCLLQGKDFYDILFHALNEKLELIKQYPDEMHFIHMASRESNTSIYASKNALLQKYTALGKTNSIAVYSHALQSIDLKKKNDSRVLEALMLYTTSIMNKYLLQYQDTPDAFFSEMPRIQKEFRIYLEYMINGIAKTREEKNL